jgi:hypothetical protein
MEFITGIRFMTLLAGALAPTTPAQGISSPVNPESSRNKELAGSAFGLRVSRKCFWAEGSKKPLLQ